MKQREGQKDTQQPVEQDHEIKDSIMKKTQTQTAAPYATKTTPKRNAQASARIVAKQVISTESATAFQTNQMKEEDPPTKDNKTKTPGRSQEISQRGEKLEVHSHRTERNTRNPQPTTATSGTIPKTPKHLQQRHPGLKTKVSMKRKTKIGEEEETKTTELSQPTTKQNR